MNGHDPFEQRLRGLPPAKLPASWRNEILGAARAADLRRNSQDQGTSWQSQLVAWLWPHPTAWAGLAAVWLLALGLNAATREPARLEFARPAGPASGEVREMLKRQVQMFAELAGPIEHLEAERPRPAAPQPRSQRRESIVNV